MLVTHSSIVNWNLVVKILVVQTPNVHLKADLPSANVPPDTAEILTQIVFVILAVQIHVVSEAFLTIKRLLSLTTSNFPHFEIVYEELVFWSTKLNFDFVT